VTEAGFVLRTKAPDGLASDNDLRAIMSAHHASAIISSTVSSHTTNMPVTTRRRAAALAAVRPSALKASPSSRTAARSLNSPTLTKAPTHREPKRGVNGKPIGARRRLKSLTPVESDNIASRFGHRLYQGEAVLNDATTVSPTIYLQYGGLSNQARYYYWKLSQISADMQAAREPRLLEVRLVLECATKMLELTARKASFSPSEGTFQ